ncbi:MAG: TonB-dependent receptor [Prevotellaceae bacterium]|jgi:iron complex outermembrane receptor protein|nr:TonB-dependent receptor [Prevotellaceae bacterium]
MKKYIIVLTILLQSINIFSQKIQILNIENSQPVPFANVYFPDLKTSTETDKNGFFTMANPQKLVLTQISSIGYKTFLGIIDTQRDTIISIEPSAHDLQEVLVSVSASKLQGENVANVKQLSLHNSDIQSINLTDKLKNVAGLDNYSTGAGIGKPVIRGLSGNRIAVFSQGVRVENQQWGDEHGLGLDENGYEDVEIIKGPASLLYGSDALGGVLYFVDERYAQENSVEAALSSQYQTNTSGLRNTAAIRLSKKQLHFNAFGGYTTHKDYADGNAYRVQNSRFNTGDFKTTLGFTGKKFVSSLRYNFLKEKYGLTEDEHEPYTNGRIPVLPYQDLITHLLSWESTFFFDNKSKLKVNLGYIFNDRQEFEDKEHAEAESNSHEAALDMHLSTLSYNAKWDLPEWNRWKMFLGSQGMYQKNSNLGEEMLIPDASTLDFGLFAMLDFRYSKKAYWQIGLRADNRNINSVETGEFAALQQNYPALNFSTGVFQPIVKNLSLRLNLSSGFRAPNMYELLSNGIHEGTNRYERGDRNLKTENACQADFSVDYRSEHLELFVNPYFNYIRNFIYIQPTNEQIDAVQVYDYLQANAFLFGGEAGFHLHPHPLDWLHLESTYSSTFGTLAQGEYLPLMPPQKIRTTLRVAFTRKGVLQKISGYAQHEYSFAQNRITTYETQTPDYNLINCGIGAEFKFGKQRLLLSISANNLLNEIYFDHLSRYKSERVFNIGRNVIFKVSVPFSSVKN